MQNIVGTWVVGDNFFGRKQELKEIKEFLLVQKTSCFIPGPRRIGKTSLIQEFIRQNSNKKQKIIYLDLENKISLIDFCSDVKNAIEKYFPDLKKGNFKSRWNTIAQMFEQIRLPVIDLKTRKIDIPVKELCNGLKDIIVKASQHGLIIAIDEFSEFILALDNKKDQNFFLKWLRGLRQEEKILFIITGSINIISTLEEIEMSYLLNDVREVKIRPLSEEEVEDLFLQLCIAKSLVLSDEARAFLLSKLVDGCPNYTQLLIDKIGELNQGNTGQLEIDVIKKQYNELTGRSRLHFNEFYERLKKYLPEPECLAARKILYHLARKELQFDDMYPLVDDLLQSKKKMNKLVQRLIDENYIKCTNFNYSFVSPILKDWWKNYINWEE